MAKKNDLSSAPVSIAPAPELILLSGDQRRQLIDGLLSNRLAKLN